MSVSHSSKTKSALPGAALIRSSYSWIAASSSPAVWSRWTSRSRVSMCLPSSARAFRYDPDRLVDVAGLLVQGAKGREPLEVLPFSASRIAMSSGELALGAERVGHDEQDLGPHPGGAAGDGERPLQHGERLVHLLLPGERLPEIAQRRRERPVVAGRGLHELAELGLGARRGARARRARARARPSRRASPARSSRARRAAPWPPRSRRGRGRARASVRRVCSTSAGTLSSGSAFS